MALNVALCVITNAQIANTRGDQIIFFSQRSRKPHVVRSFFVNDMLTILQI